MPNSITSQFISNTELPNILTAEEFKNLPPDANTCIVIEGMTYAGRHTQAKVMAEEYDLPMFKFSDWVQKYKPANEIEAATIQYCLKNAVYLPDDLRVKIANWALDEFYTKHVQHDAYYNRPFVMAGYPRTIEHARHFQEFLKAKNIYAIIIVIEINSAEAKRRMSESAVTRAGHERDTSPDVQRTRISEYYLKTHGYLKWLLFTGKATGFKTTLDKGEYERRKHEGFSVVDRGDYVVMYKEDVTKMIMKFLNMIHFVESSGA
jgi:adenylate kinase family enzyme